MLYEAVFPALAGINRNPNATADPPNSVPRANGDRLQSFTAAQAVRIEGIKLYRHLLTSKQILQRQRRVIHQPLFLYFAQLFDAVFQLQRR